MRLLLYQKLSDRPKGIYQEPDLKKRAEIIEADNSSWNISQFLLGLSAILTATGFTTLAVNLRGLANAWIPTSGAAAIVVGAVSAVIFIYRQTTDPLGSYEGAYSSAEMLYYWLTIAGLLLFGIAPCLPVYQPGWAT